MNLTDFYNLIGSNTAQSAIALKVLWQTHWYTLYANFDTKTGKALPQPLSCFLQKIAGEEHHNELHDRLFRIAEHCARSLKVLYHSLNETPRREQAVLPLRSIREFDVGSFIKLSQRPGRTIREKLAEKPYAQAVRHTFTVDLPENRLLKTFSQRLSKLIELRSEVLGEHSLDALANEIRNWLNTENAKNIAKWDNPPPNNTLLSHQDYRRVWDAWCWLRTIDEDIEKDFNSVDERQKTIEYWSYLSKLSQNKGVVFAEMPLLFNFDDFSISPWHSDKLFIKNNGKGQVLQLYDSSIPIGKESPKEVEQQLTNDIACVDITKNTPCFATHKGKEKGAFKLLWQYWLDNKDNVNLNLFSAEAMCCGKSITTISALDLFNYSTVKRSMADAAARMFAQKLRKHFKNDKLIWLMPDHVNDFEIEVLRRNINLEFKLAEPLPYSIAAIYQNLKRISSALKDGFSIAFICSFGNKLTATKLVARYDKKLHSLLPETLGYTWERYPAVVVKEKTDDNVYWLDSVDASGNWFSCNASDNMLSINIQEIKKLPEIGDVTTNCIIEEAPVEGGLRFFDLQSKIADYPLWYDCLPELSTKIPINGIYNYFYFVKKAKIAPKRGVAITIPLNKNFILPPEQLEYIFPLAIGSGNNASRFVARLVSPAFPVKKPLVCDLRMTYTYGADNPYELIFIPQDKNIAPIVAKWEEAQTQTYDVNSLPCPVLPQSIPWENYQHFLSNKGNPINIYHELDILIDFMQDRFAFMQYEMGMTTNNQSSIMFGEISQIEYDSSTNSSRGMITYHGGNIRYRFGNNQLKLNDHILFTIKQKNGKRVADIIGNSDKIYIKLTNRLRSELALHIRRMTTLHSFSDSTCPADLTKKITAISCYMQQFIGLTKNSQLKVMCACCLACLGDICPQKVGKLFSKMAPKDIETYFWCLPYAIGNVTAVWQVEFLKHLTSIMTSKTSFPVSYDYLSIAIWRTNDLITKIPPTTVIAICNGCLNEITRLNRELSRFSCAKSRDEGRFDVRHLAKVFELLFALIMTRKSSDNSLKNIFIPNNDFSSKLIAEVDKTTALVVQLNLNLPTRLNFLLSKPDTFSHVPNLLYAVRAYLSGDNGANTISICGINEDED